MANWLYDTRQETPETSEELQRLGSYQYMLEHPQTYNPNYKWWQDAKYGAPSNVQAAISNIKTCQAGLSEVGIKTQALRDLRSQFTDTESIYVRWLIDNELKRLRYIADDLRASARASALEAQVRLGKAEATAMATEYAPVSIEGMEQVGDLPGKTWNPPQGYVEKLGEPGEARVEKAKAALEKLEAVEKPKYSPAPIPTWMQPYIEAGMGYTSAPTGETMGQETTTLPGGVGQLRPMGAQAELTPEQLAQMAGYQAWGRAGFPTQLRGANMNDLITQMSDWEKWWQPYIQLSEKLFPAKTRLRANWATATQR